jgi:hypothetical protein
MDEKNEKAVKNGFSQARRSYGEGRGLVRRWLPVTFKSDFLRPGRIWLQSKVDRAQEGTVPGIPTNFLLWQKPPGRLNGRNSPPKWPNSPQKGSLGVLIHPKTVPNVEISKLSKFGR